MNEAFGGFFNWRSHSLGEYISIVLLLAAVIALAYGYTHRNNRLRTDPHAARRVGRRLRREDKDARIYERISLPLRGETAVLEHLVLDHSGILLIKSFGRGLEIYGQAREETWMVLDRELRTAIPNPVLQLEKSIEPLRSLLAEHGIFQVPIAPLAVFDDNLDPPKLYLGSTAAAVTFQQLKPLLRKRAAAAPAFDMTAVAAVLDRLDTAR